MSKRLPQPGQPKRVRLVVEDDELARLDVMAAETRLSVASFVRALVVAAINDWPEVQAKVKAAAERLAAAELPEGRRRPGRPTDPPPPPEPRKPKGRR